MPAEFDFEKRVAGQRMSAQDYDFNGAVMSKLDTRLSDEDMDSLFDGDNAEEDERIWMLLSLYNDGEASPEEAAEVEQLLQHDAAYANAHAFMQQAGGAIRTISEIEPPANLCEAILAKTTRRPTFAQRVAQTLAGVRSRFALPSFHPVGRMALAGGGLATVALAAGIVSGRMGVQSSPNGTTSAIARRTTSTTAPAQSVATNSSTTQEHAPIFTPVRPLVLPTSSDLIHSNANHTQTAHVATPSHLSGSVVPTSGKTGILPDANQARSHNSAIASNKTVGKKMPGVDQQIASGGTVQGANHIDEDVQNINPMMDNNVQHRTTLTGLSDKDKNEGDDLNDDRLVASTTTSEMSTDATPMPAEHEAPIKERRMEGQLMLAKLPPTARHLMSPADVVRQVSNTVPASFSANASDSSQHKPAEVRLLSTKF